MPRSHDELLKKVKPEVRERARKKAVEVLAEMSLAELRRARGQNQTEIARALDLAQPNVSRIEHRSDALVSTLREYIEALGGELEIHARFPDGQDIEITTFRES